MQLIRLLMERIRFFNAIHGNEDFCSARRTSSLLPMADINNLF